MPMPDEQLAQVEDAIARLEAHRALLGDSVVDVAVAALRAQHAALRASVAPPAGPGGELPPAQLLARLQSYLPKELAEKMRATGRIESERKQVTVMFADLSGFTALSERRDVEEIAALTNEALKDLAEAVYQYEGYIDKFVGDAIMAVFGAPVTHEDDPERALRTALAMRERLAAFNRRWAAQLDEPLTLHIGINTGPVIAGNVGSDLRLTYTVMGDTVNTASRLEAAAQPSQILVSQATHRLTQEAFAFRALEPLTVKGKREPLIVFELLRARLHPGKVRGLKDLTPAFVGREQELAQLHAVAVALEAGRGHIVTLSGEAGLGKSRLMAEWRAAAGPNTRWLEGRAFAHTSGLAYGPFLDLFRRYAGITDDDSESEARARLHSMVEALFPGDAEAHAVFANMLAMQITPAEAALLAGLPGEALRRRLFSLVEQLFGRLSLERPTWLMIEDMHWADATSLDLVEHLLPLTADRPLAIVGIFRLHPDEAPDRFQAAVARRYPDRFTPIRLAPLTEAASVEMIEKLLATPHLPVPLRTLILSKAEGNPFFVEEVIRTLIERGALMRAETDESWVTTPRIDNVTVPDSLQGLLMARLDHLPDETRWVAQQAAVIGRIFLYRVLLQMVERSAGVDADLSHLERNELIRQRAHDPEIEYIFKHALTQEVAYGSLLVARRKELHCRVGAALEAIFAGRLAEFHSVLATHFLKGEAWEQAVAYLTLAGDAAARLYAHVEARLHYGPALEALAHLPDSAENRRRRVDTTINLVSVSVVADNPEVNLRRLAEAERLARELAGAPETAEHDRLRLARVHYWMGRSHFYRNESREAIGYYRQVLAVAQETGDEELIAIPSSVLGQVTLLIQGQYDKAERLLAQAIPPLEKVGDWAEWIRAVGYLGLARTGRGQYALGVADGRRALERAQVTNNRTAIGLAHLLLSGSYRFGGQFPEHLREAEQALDTAAQSGDRLQAYIGYAHQGWAQSMLGRHAAAAASMAQSRDLGQSLGGERLILAPVFAAASAEIAFNAGRIDEALALAEETVTVARTTGNLLAEGLAQRVWGQALAGCHPPRLDDAEVHMAASQATLQAGEIWLEVAHTQRAWGLICRDRGNPAAARDHLQQAADCYASAGLAWEIEHAQLLLQALV